MCIVYIYIYYKYIYKYIINIYIYYINIYIYIYIYFIYNCFRAHGVPIFWEKKRAHTDSWHPILMEVGFLIQFLNDAAHQQMAFMEAPENIEQKYAIFAGGVFMPSMCDLVYVYLWFISLFIHLFIYIHIYIYFVLFWMVVQTLPRRHTTAWAFLYCFGLIISVRQKKSW